MIDWAASNNTPGAAKSRDLVTVICEKCNESRQINFYQAKKSTTHVCGPCSRQIHPFKRGEIVTYTCAACGTTKSQPYHQKRFKNWLCINCSRKESGKTAASKLSLLWSDPEYVAKQKAAREKTKEKRSATSKEIWSDPTRLEQLSETIKNKWADPEYRRLKTAQSQSLWLSEEYAEKQRSGLNRPEVRERAANARASQLTKVSSIQQILYSVLDDLNADYVKEGPGTTIGYFTFDCLINAPRKILIECQGDYWHSLPKVRSRDRSKFTYISRYFPEYQIVYLWEHEFYTHQRIVSKLSHLLGLATATIPFNFADVEIKRAKASDYRALLDSYHYLKDGRGGEGYCAYLGSEPIACVVFSGAVRQNCLADHIEISRFCIHPSYQKRNFGSWFLSRAMRLSGHTKFMAFADTTVGHTGALYKATNFKLHHEVQPDYWYVDSDGFVMHKKTLYNRAKKQGMTEAAYSEKFGYIKKYGGKKLCYVKSTGRAES